MITVATISAPVAGAGIGAVVGLLGALAGLWVNGDRAERQRKRELHARALAAGIAYGEMPFRIRRRRWEESEQSAERIRLSDEFSKVQVEISTCQVLLAADGDKRVSKIYKQLIDVARKTAGAEAHQGWTKPAIKTDAEMNMGPLFDQLAEFRVQLALFEESLAEATLPRRTRCWRRLSGEGKAQA